ncbi:ABC transporter permease subunit [Lentzea atacamensis]|uniref:ABC transporter permease subunit n=1 Tax=Lentzea atacamensis TaxID=531938 RepID=UPI001C027821|nr:ABC transporter permease subunit [Lentzea atacamensis]
MINVVGIFWLRQHISGAVHDELPEAARLDGCGFSRQYWPVELPVVRPALAFLGIFTFISVWNDCLWPLVDPDRVALQVALDQLNRTHDTDYGNADGGNGACGDTAAGRLPRRRAQFHRGSGNGCRARLICDTKNGFVFSE